jgi:hypothetical protein
MTYTIKQIRAIAIKESQRQWKVWDMSDPFQRDLLNIVTYLYETTPKRSARM